tara:strand:- start:795 stop:2099 length:1305 start_codon:yes stop_codon:yes gene_type:complete
MADIKFSLESLTNPQGRNGLASFAAYYQRLLYKEAIYPENLWAPLDTWYDKQYYGKVDKIQNTIVVDETKLKAVDVAGDSNVLALNFVADAFGDLAAHMRQAAAAGVCISNGNPALTDLSARKGYENPRQVYAQFLNAAYGSFDSSTDRYTDKIIDFTSFRREFIAYLKRVAAHMPITLSNYLLTGTISGFTSGLTVAIATAPFDGDNYKYEEFIADPNFSFYVRAAKKFGFIVNKNAPWLLTADLFTDASLKYIEHYDGASAVLGLTENNFFDFYYTPTYLLDVQILDQYLLNSYRSYVEKNPYYQRRIYKKTSCATFGVENLLRAPIATSITGLNSDKILANLYLDLRSVEADTPIVITQKLRSEMNGIYYSNPDPSLTGLQNVAKYINLIYRDYIYSSDYPSLNQNIFLNLDNQVRTGNITTVGSIIQQLY